MKRTFHGIAAMPPKRRKKQANAPVKLEVDCMLPEVKPEPKPKRTRKVKKEELAPVIPGWPEWSVPLDYEVPKREPKLEPEPTVEVKLEPKVVPTHSVKTGRRLIARAVRRLRQKRRPRTRKIPLPPHIHDQSKTKYDPKDRPACRRQTYEDTDMSYDEADPDVELLETFHPWRAIRYKKPPKIEKRLTAVGVNTSHLRHYNKVFTRHPESAERIEHTLQRLKVCSEHMFDFLYVNKFVKKFKDVDKKVLDFLESQKTHSKEYLQELINLADHADMNVQTWCTQFDSVQMTRETTDVCIESLFLCFYMATAIHIGNYFNGFALVRPPGHHAQYDCPAGFCVINNVAATAAYLLRKPDIHRVLIIDVDVHHGNGTQELFYDRDDVTYISIHRYEQGKFWPYKRESDYDNIGEGKGKGHNMNVCINENGSHDTDYMYIFTELILPVALELNPDYVIFSLGYDACYGDPIGIMDIEADVFSHMIYHLNVVCNGKILCVLEGGYNHSSVAVGVDNNVRVLSTMKPVPLHCRKAVRESTARSVYDLICVIQPYWPVLWSYYTFLPPHVRTHKQRKPKYVNDQHITTGDINQQKLFDAYMDYEIKLSVPPEYQVFKPSKRFPTEEIPNTKYYYLFGIEDVRHTTFDLNQNFIGYVYHLAGVKLKMLTNALFRVYPEHFDDGPPPSRPTKKFRPIPDKEGEFPWYALIYESVHIVTRNDSSSRCLIVTWGFHRQVRISTTRHMQVNVGIGEGNARTAHYFPINLTEVPTVDGLIYLCAKLLPVFYYAEPHFVYLCLDKDSPPVFTDPQVLRVLLWMLQGVNNRRLIVYWNGTDLTDDITAYTCDPYYRKDESEMPLPKPRLQLDEQLVKDIVESFWNPPQPSLPEHQRLIMRPIPRRDKSQLLKPAHDALSRVGRRMRLAQGLTESSECDFSVPRTKFNVDEATSRKYLPYPVEYTDASSVEEYSSVTYVSEESEKEEKKPRIVLRIPKKEPVMPSSSESSSDEDNAQRPRVGGTGSSNPPTDDEAERDGEDEVPQSSHNAEVNGHHEPEHRQLANALPAYEEVDRSYDADDDEYDQNDDGDVGISGDEYDQNGDDAVSGGEEEDGYNGNHANAVPSSISSSSSSSSSSDSSSDSDNETSSSGPLTSDSEDDAPLYNPPISPPPQPPAPPASNRKRTAAHFTSSSSASNSSASLPSSDDSDAAQPQAEIAGNANSLADLQLSSDSDDA